MPQVQSRDLVVAGSPSMVRHVGAEKLYGGSVGVLPALALALTIVLALGSAHAAHLTTVKNHTGPSQATAVCMVQDQRGFIWIGTQDGLNRFDGYEFKVYSRANSQGLRGNWIGALFPHPDGSLWVGSRNGIDRLDPETETFKAVDLSPVGPCDVRNITMDEKGWIWISTNAHGLLRIHSEGSDVDHRPAFADPVSGIDCVRINGVLRHSNGDIWVMTAAAGIHVVDEKLQTHRILAAELRNPNSNKPYALYGAIEADDTRVWVASSGAGLLKFDPTGDLFEQHTWDEPLRNNLTTVILDSKNRLWLGTWNGVTEYWPDSDRWRHNSPDRADPSRLDDGLVHSLLEDRGGTVWVGTWGSGLYRYNPDSDRFRSYKGFFRGPGTGPGYVENPVKSIVEDAAGRIWVGLNRLGRVMEFDPDTEEFNILTSVKRPSARLGAVHAHGTDLFIGWTNGKVDRVSPDDGSVETISARYPLLENDLHDHISTVRVDPNGWLWIGTRTSGLFAVDLASQDARHFMPTEEGLAGPRVNDVLPASDKRVWLGTSGGLQLFDRESGRFETYAVAPGRADSLPHNMVTTILRDSAGRLWIGTQGGGVALMTDDSGPGHFEVVDSSFGLGADAVGVILEGGDGGIWASTTRGLSRIDPLTLAVLNFVPADGVLDGGFYIGSGASTTTGDLYFGGFTGMISVDTAFSTDPADLPEVELTAISVNGVPLKGAHHRDDESIELSHTANNLSFEFTALSTRKPSLIRYAYRLVPFTEEWTEQDADRRFATFFNLPADTYRFEVKAKEPAGEWSSPTTRTVVKRPPWYSSPAAKLVYGLSFAAAVILAGSILNRRRRRRHERRRKNELALKDLAYVDQLTRLPNRVQMERRLEGLLREVVEGREIHILFVDLDHFKDINDSLGHEIGDRVLIRVARRVSEVIGEEALVCRWGGDEFVALLEGRSLEQVERIARSVIDELARPFSIDSYEFIVTASVGIAEASQKGTDSASVLRSAEAALYRAKQLGKSSWCLYDESVSKQTLDRVELERDLREAIAARDIRVVYQPMYDRNGNIVAAEALARWQQDGSVEIPPSRFIRVAEETGIILDLDRHVLDTVLQQALDLERRNLLNFRLSINMSALEFRRRDLADRLLEVIGSAGLAPECIELEVTEGVVLSEPENARKQIAALRSAGLTVAIDDFGTGYSALSYLTSLEVDRLKIDRSFVQRLDQGKVERAIVAGVVQIAASLGIEVVAEGVENKQQLDILKDLGCHVFQGFYLARPETFEDLVTRL